MGTSTNDPQYPIAAVSKLTGVGCHSLRVWERRYGFPVPMRTESGHRRYGHDQVVVLKAIAERVRGGSAIGELIAEFRRAGVLGGNGEDAPHQEDEPRPDALMPERPEVSRLIEPLLEGDLEKGRRYFDELASQLGPEALIQELVAPTLTETGERWFRRSCSIYQERVISGFLRRKLDGMIDDARRSNPANGPTVIVGSVQGDRHEGGVLIVELLLQRAGWRVINLGVDLPVEQFRKAVDRLRADALALSFVLSRSINKRFEELSRIKEVPVFLGGRSILNYQALARRYGLIPVVGPADQAVRLLQEEYTRWKKGGRPAPPVADDLG